VILSGTKAWKDLSEYQLVALLQDLNHRKDTPFPYMENLDGNQRLAVGGDWQVIRAEEAGVIL